MTTSTKPDQKPAWERIAMNIVFQLGDFYELPVDKRQSTNDEAIDFVQKLLVEVEEQARKAEREEILNEVESVLWHQQTSTDKSLKERRAYNQALVDVHQELGSLRP